jgi:hypothetical protein
MDSALLQNLMAGAGSSSQFIGGLVVALLYVVIGLLAAIGSIVVFRRIFQGRWEQIFWASFLVVIAAFYLSFAAYFGASQRMLGKLKSSALPFSLFALWVGCFPDLLSPLAMSCMGSGISPIVCPALPLRACR